MRDHELIIQELVCDELNRVKKSLDEAGLYFSDVDLTVRNRKPEEYTSEIAVYFYRHNEVVDVLEFFVFIAGEENASAEDTRSWVDKTIAQIIADASSQNAAN